MSAETIDHSTLSRLVEAGAVNSAHVVGQKGGWSIVIRYGKTASPLAAQRSKQVRLFKRMDTLVSYLKEVGISQFDVDAAGYVPGGASRPDRAEALRRAHEAAEYERWFIEQIDEAIRETDDPNTVWIPHEVVEEEMARERAELLALLKNEGK